MQLTLISKPVGIVAYCQNIIITGLTKLSQFNFFSFSGFFKYPALCFFLKIYRIVHYFFFFIGFDFY